MIHLRAYLGALLLPIALSHAAMSGQPSQPLVIGVLEDTPGHMADEPNFRAVRVVFRKTSTGWAAYPSNCPDEKCLKSIAMMFPAKTHWTIAFGGQQIGQVESRAPTFFEYYASIGQQKIVGTASPPTVGKPSREFGGFTEEAVYRPLVAISRPNFQDPDRWRIVQPPAGVVEQVRKAYRARFPRVTNCTKDDVETELPWSYSNADIRLHRVYVSRSEWYLAELSLQEYICDGPPDEPFKNHWFVVTPNGTVRFLDSSMWLVDAGDYDNDGKSELVFSIDDYNRGGYKLFSDEFRKKAVFKFSYH
jgi:hypothetical protein